MLYTVYYHRYTLFISLLLLFLTACSGGGYNQSGSTENTPDPEDKTSWNARFPAGTYITAWGVSTESMRQAEQDAKAMVAAAVRSSIASELTSEMQSESFGGEIRDHQRLESITKIRTHFEHAELIRLVPPTAHHRKGEYWVMAALSRREAAEELMIPYREEAATFRFLAARLDSLQDNPPGFTKTWQELKKHYKKMEPEAAEVRAVAGGNLPEIIRDDALYSGAQNSRLILLENLEFALLLAEHPQLNHEELSSRISAALATLGLSVVGDSCRPGAVGLKVSPETTWTNVMGRVVQLELKGEVGFCTKGEPWSLFRIHGSEMRGEGRTPMKDLWQQQDPDFLKDQLKMILTPYLPFD